MCKIAILEKYPLFSSGIKLMLAGVEDFSIIAVASDMNELELKLAEQRPEVLVVDALHCHNAGIHVLKTIKQHFPDLPVLLITSEDYLDCFRDYFDLGVKGIVYYNDSEADLINSIKELNRGQVHLRKNALKIFQKRRKNGEPVRYAQERKHILTRRELSVLRLLCKGLTFKEIGKKLFISPRTVETHKKNIMAKMEVHSTAAMIKYATHHKMT